MKESNELYRHTMHAVTKSFKSDAIDYVRSYYGLSAHACAECFAEGKIDHDYFTERILKLTANLNEALAYIDYQFRKQEEESRNEI
ncbi:hypothetical protein [Halalkalibacter flavus]|uniref:hypothetical protein n=1 Tax=Halalkalibacter flavus TaxID=3090668 RepID=UPI002FC87F03